MIRQATFFDVDQCVDLAIESVRQQKWPFNIDRNKIKSIAQVSIMQKAAWVSEESGKIIGVVGGIIQDGAWFVGNQLEIVIFYCKDKSGMQLLRKLRDFIKEQKINMATVTLESFMDARHAKLFKRLGFRKQSTVCIYLRESDE